jgi:primosomal protein N' (replication factor Y)
MLYAKVVVGLPLEGPFDYLVPQAWQNAIKPGCRVRVSFGPRKLIGYVVGLSRKSLIEKVKPITGLIDINPILSKELLSLTFELAGYYCCSWGEAIEAALPEPLRKGKGS